VDIFFATDTLELFVLQDAQELCLQIGREIANLIEKNRFFESCREDPNILW
jgi:hypothetical protein